MDKLPTPCTIGSFQRHCGKSRLQLNPCEKTVRLQTCIPNVPHSTTSDANAECFLSTIAQMHGREVLVKRLYRVVVRTRVPRAVCLGSKPLHWLRDFEQVPLPSLASVSTCWGEGGSLSHHED